MATRCPYCRMVNSLDARQCGGCGHDLVGSSQPEPGRWSWLGNLFGGASSRSAVKPTAPTEQLSSRCPYCRVANFTNARNCTGCGHPLNVPLQIQRYKPPFSERFKNYLDNHWKGMGGAIAVLVVALFVAGTAIAEKTAESAKQARCTSIANGMLAPKYYKVTKTRRIRFIPITTTYYEVTYTFEVNGRTYSGKGEMGFEPVRPEIVVNYEPEDPTNNYTDSNK